MDKRKRYDAEKKVAVLMELLKNGKKVSEVAEEFSIHPNMIMKWEKKLFEGAVETFSVTRNDTAEKSQSKKIEELQKQLEQKDAVIAELATENLGLKKKYTGQK